MPDSTSPDPTLPDPTLPDPTLPEPRMAADDLGRLPIFAGLSSAQLEQLAGSGTAVEIRTGEVMFGEGEPADFWWLLVDGSIDLLRHVGREDTVVARMDAPGRWAGGFKAWDEHGTYLATGRGAQPGRVFKLPADVLRERFADWFPFGAHLISGLYHTARSIESTARQRSLLITLGTLAAGLAHELNNPAAAATRAADALDVASRGLLDSLSWLAHNQITAEQFAALDALRRELAPQPTYLDPLDRSDWEQALLAWLSRRGVDQAWRLASALTAAGVDVGWCARVEAVLPGADLEPGLRWVADTASVRILLGEVRESTGRVSELVSAVRSYSQMDRASRQRVRLSEGLDSTLVMLAHKTKGIRIERDFGEDVPEIEAYPGELNQVWTNLIDNAADAMAGDGTLRVATRLDGDAVEVTVGDTGPGLPPDVLERAFEPFFTTKDVGRGTGLGLDIARRVVVERHGGAIEIDSRPGDTVVRVRLPLSPA